MAFKRRGTGRDEMLKRNQQRATARRRTKQTKTTSKKEDLKVGSKETASYMKGVGPYKDGEVYSSALPKQKPKTTATNTNNTKQEKPPAPQGNQQREKPPTEEKPTTTTKVKQHGNYLPSNPQLKSQNKPRPVVSSTSNVEDRQTQATAALKRKLKQLMIQFRNAKSAAEERGRNSPIQY